MGSLAIAIACWTQLASSPPSNGLCTGSTALSPGAGRRSDSTSAMRSCEDEVARLPWRAPGGSGAQEEEHATSVSLTCSAVSLKPKKRNLPHTQDSAYPSTQVQHCEVHADSWQVSPAR